MEKASTPSTNKKIDKNVERDVDNVDLQKHLHRPDCEETHQEEVPYPESSHILQRQPVIEEN